MSDLVTFLRARLDEDERELVKDPPVGLGYANLPARVLREVEAKRSVVKMYEDAVADASSEVVEWMLAVIETEARVYRDHSDYDPAWAS